MLPINASIKSIIMLGGGLALILFVVTTLVSFFATVNYQDAVIVSKRYFARQLTDPGPGQLFVLRDDILEGRPVCHLELGPTDIEGHDVVSKYTFSNVVGDLAPFLANINFALVGKDAAIINADGAESFQRIWVAKELYVRSFNGKLMASSCLNDVLEALYSGAKVCTVDRAIVDAANPQNVRAIGFRGTCAIKCPDGQTNCETNKFGLTQELNWTTKVKSALNLVHLKKSPVEN